MSNLGVVMNGGVGAHDRHARDRYDTPEECTEALLNVWNPGRVVWEPAAGGGAMARVLERRGHVVRQSDVEMGWDFLTGPAMPGGFDAIVTNPPFNLAADFIRRAAGYGVPFALLLKSTYWHASGRQALWDDHTPAAIHAMTWRPNFAPDRGNAPTMDVIWCVWDPAPSSACVYMPIGRP